MINTYDLDDAIENSSADQFVGQQVQWHFGTIGIVEKLSNGKIVIRLELPCFKCGKLLSDILVRSGLNHGAFCYVCDEDGNYVANLRDQNVTCEEDCK